MATHDYVIDNGTGSAVRADLNLLFKAILTNNSGTTDPSTVISSDAGSKAFSFWADTNSSPAVLKIRNAADDGWIELFQLDGTLTLEDGSASTPALAFRDDLNTGIFSSAADKFNVATAGTERMELAASGTVFNEDGADVDFRVEGDTQGFLFFVDASTDRIGINTSTPTSKFTISGENDASNFEVDVAGTEFVVHTNATTGEVSLRSRDGSGNNNAKFMTFHTHTASAGASAERMRIDSSGRVLIGTTTEGFASFGDTLTIATSADTGITVRSGTTNRGSIFFSDATSGDAEKEGFIQYNHDDGRLVFGTTQTERVRIDGSGNVGIGSTSPIGKLQVVNGNVVLSDSYNFQFGQNADRACISGVSGASGRLQIDVNNDEKMRITASGNVGIASTSPTEKLEINLGTDKIVQFTGGIGQIGNVAGMFAVNTAKTEIADFGIMGNTLNFASGTALGGAEAMRLDASQNLLIGTTSTSNNASGTKVEASGQLLVNIRNSTDTNVFLNKVGVNGTFITFSKDSSTKGSITTDGTNTAYNTSSDYRLKENETLISDGITRLKTLKPYRFNWKSNPTRTVDGFFAHEVTAVPEAVTGIKDEIATEDNDELGYKKNEPIYQSLDYSKLTPLLTAALQEAITKIEVLETKVAALEAA